MARKSKAQLARKVYGVALRDLSAGQKSHISRLFNQQSGSSTRAPRRTATRSAGCRVEVGKLGENGTKVCIVPAGSTVRDMLSQARMTLDPKTEDLLIHPSGEEVELDDVVKDGTTYMVTTNVDSN